ncbi:MAG: hypothetical protein QW324_06745, partial [Thermofilaceae archaeon]
MRRSLLALLLAAAVPLAVAVTVQYYGGLSTGGYLLRHYGGLTTLNYVKLVHSGSLFSGFEETRLETSPIQPPGEQPPPSQPPPSQPPEQPPPSQPPEEQPPEQPEQPPEQPTEEPWYKRAWRGFIELLQRLLQYARGYPWL